MPTARPVELIGGEQSAAIRVRLNGFPRGGELEERLNRMGWSVEVHASPARLFWGAGGRRA